MAVTLLVLHDTVTWPGIPTLLPVLGTAAVLTAGVADPVNGIRQFIVGTGGAGMTPMPIPKPNSEVRQALNYGVLKLTLASNHYDWEFLPAVEGVVVDSGSATCR